MPISANVCIYLLVHGLYKINLKTMFLRDFSFFIFNLSGCNISCLTYKVFDFATARFLLLLPTWSHFKRRSFILRFFRTRMQWQFQPQTRSPGQQLVVVNSSLHPQERMKKTFLYCLHWEKVFSLFPDAFSFCLGPGFYVLSSAYWPRLSFTDPKIQFMVEGGISK